MQFKRPLPIPTSLAPPQPLAGRNGTRSGSEEKFKLKSSFKPSGDQPKAIQQLTEGLVQGKKHQVLLGVTGSGKTFTIANVIQQTGKPCLVISHNKTLAAQLHQELKNFFPDNAVHYFVSYYDYYQPEAYIPQTSTYIQKDAKINDEIDRLRHSSTQSLLTRQDVIIVASVSCIYGIGDPNDYEQISIKIKQGDKLGRQELLRSLIDLQYQRNDFFPEQGEFQVKGDMIRIYSAGDDKMIEIIFWGNYVEDITTHNLKPLKNIIIYPAKHFATPKDKINQAIRNIKLELKERLAELKKAKKYLEYQRLKEKTGYDLAMLKETGYVSGIENYSRHLSFRLPGKPPFTLIDYFRHKAGDNFLTIIDESHATIPQIKGMFEGDRSRKSVLIEHGFRLPSALDNRPLNLKEFEKKLGAVIYISATPAKYELRNSDKPIEQIIRPTGLIDPKIKILPTKNQIPALLKEIHERIKNKERVLITTITKRLAEELSGYLSEQDIKVQYIHSDIKTFERSKILTNLRKGKIDVLVGVNLLREGLDLPEVSLVVIFDADKEGFLRNEVTLIQTMGRAARHLNGKVILFADTETVSIKNAVKESSRRRKIQLEYNQKNNIIPKPIKKKIIPFFTGVNKPKKNELVLNGEIPPNLPLSKGGEFNSLPQFEKIEWLHKEMKKAADNLEFERAVMLRDFIKKLDKIKN